jgi:GNAT superfamily N-acetyltransferase
MKLYLRKAEMSDVQLLAEMNKQLIEDECSETPLGLQGLQDRIISWLEAEWQIDLMYFDSTVIGYALYQYRHNLYDENRKEVYIRQYFIRREHRNQGLGRVGIKMLREERFKEIETINIDVLESNPKGLNFWKTVGFQPYYTNMRLR